MISKLLRLRLNAFGIVSLLGLGIYGWTPPVFAQPDGPNSGTPYGDPQPPPSRPEAVCPTTEIPITGLFENEGRDYTTVAQPTFFIYIPYTDTEVSYMEFYILDEKEEETIYAVAITPLAQAGIIKISLPPEDQLELSQLYRWYFSVSCYPTMDQTPDLQINGWIRFVNNDQGSEDVIVYDQINDVLDDKTFVSPTDLEWLNLREEVNTIEQLLPNQEYTIIEPELLLLTD